MTLTLLALLCGLPSCIFILAATDRSTDVSGRVTAFILKQTAFVYITCTVLMLINWLTK